MTVAEAPPSREEWLRERRSMIGGSDSYGCVGLTDQDGKPYFGKTPFTVWQDKVGEKTDDDETPGMRNGRLLEDALARIYEETTGRTTRYAYKIRRDKEHPFLGASLDRTVVPRFGHERRLLELKTSSRRDWWGPDGSGEAGVPEPYLFQVQHYLSVTQYDVADLMVMLSPSDVRLYEIEPNVDFIKALREREVEFWRKYVETRTPPPLTPDDAIRAFPVDNGGELVVTDETEVATVQHLLTLREQRDRLAREIEALEDGVKSWLGENRYLVVDGQRVVDWMTVKPGAPKPSLKKIQHANPELWVALCKEYPEARKAYRRFTVKKVKEVSSDD